MGGEGDGVAFFSHLQTEKNQMAYLGFIVQQVCCIHNCVQNFSSLILF